MSVHLHFRIKVLEDKIKELEQRINSLGEVDKRPAVKRVTFTPPTEQQVMLYASNAKRLNFDQAKEFASKFVAHYEANGWMVGRNKMKSWEAAVRKWDISEFLKSNKNINEITNGKFTGSDAERILADAQKL